MDLGRNIRKLREFHNLTQEFMAEQLGCSQKTYSNIEHAGNHIKFSVLEAIAATLKISVQNILDLDKTFTTDTSTHGDTSEDLKSVHSLVFDLYAQLIQEKDLRIRDLASFISKTEKD